MPGGLRLAYAKLNITFIVSRISLLTTFQQFG
jgi:hypothetical protein